MTPQQRAFHALERTALHEAAHCVVGLVHAGPLVRVDLFPDSDPTGRGHRGRAVFDYPKKLEAPDRWEDYAAMTAAGHIMDDIYTEIGVRPWLNWKSEDLDNLAECARQVRDETRAGTPPPGATVRRNASLRSIAVIGWNLAHHDLMTNYGAVLLIAEHLLARTGLTGNEVRELLAAAPNVEPPSIARHGRTFWPSLFEPRNRWSLTRPAAASAA